MNLDMNEIADWLKYAYSDTKNTWEMLEEYIKANNKVKPNRAEVIADQFSSKVVDIL